MDRRQFTKLALLSAGLAPFTNVAQAVESEASIKSRAETKSHQAHEAFMALDGVKMIGSEQIAMLIYPGFTALDLIGPQYLFASMMGAKIYLISRNNDLSPVKSDTGVAIVPTHTQSECPEALDILFLPGGSSGTVEAMKDAAFIEFIKQKAVSSKYVTSVCTGSMLLGKAGLLQGKKATSHWIALDLLARFGAIPMKERVVWDKNLITGSGVTAGIDFALQVITALRGKAYAEMVQLQAEYDPAPPYNSGSPDKADANITQMLKGMFEVLHTNIEMAI
jgi:cyclohexyl-isocyanide hydratase